MKRKYIFVRNSAITEWGSFNSDTEAQNRARQIGTLLYGRWDEIKHMAPKETRSTVDGSESGKPEEPLPF